MSESNFKEMENLLLFHASSSLLDIKKWQLFENDHFALRLSLENFKTL